MKRSIMGIAIGVTLLGASLPASASPADCLLQVEGKTYIKGICEFTPGEKGSFQIMGKDYFATLYIFDASDGKEYAGKSIGEAHWNADPASTHAQAPLGEVRRKGACWESPTVKICARALSPAKRAEIESTRPNGQMIELIEAGYPAAFPRGYRLAPGAELVLGNIQSARGELPKLFVPGSDNIQIDKHPELCIDAKPTGKANLSRLVLEDCQRVSVKWKLSEKDGSIRSTSGNLCWSLPDINADSEAWPIQIMAGPCSNKPDGNRRFGFNNGN